MLRALEAVDEFAGFDDLVFGSGPVLDDVEGELLGAAVEEFGFSEGSEVALSVTAGERLLRLLGQRGNLCCLVDLGGADVADGRDVLGEGDGALDVLSGFDEDAKSVFGVLVADIGRVAGQA